MSLYRLWICSLLSFTCLAAKKSKGRFEDFHSLALSSSPLKLEDSVYEELVAAPRDYTAIVLLTALEPRFGCQLCRTIQPEWDLLSKSWTRGDKAGASRVVYATLDFADGKNTFQKLMLQSAPNLFLFSPTVGPKAKPDGQPLRYEFGNGDRPQTAEQLHAWISRHLPDGPRPAIIRPINYVRVATITTVILGLVTLLSVTYPYLLPFVQNRNVWAAISLITILLFTSGHMFNHIRKVPYVSGDGKGGIAYFAGGFTTQFGLETQIIATIYGALSFATISLALKVPRIADARMQQVAVIAWAALMFGMYSYLLSVFRKKNGGYPFWLPPF